MRGVDLAMTGYVALHAYQRRQITVVCACAVFQKQNAQRRISVASTVDARDVAPETFQVNTKKRKKKESKCFDCKIFITNDRRFREFGTAT